MAFVRFGILMIASINVFSACARPHTNGNNPNNAATAQLPASVIVPETTRHPYEAPEKTEIALKKSSDEAIPTSFVGNIPIAVATSLGKNSSSLEAAREAAKNKTYEYFSTGSEVSIQDIEIMRKFYNESANYYGSNVNIDKIIADKRQFVTRWSVRNYTIRDQSLHVTCSDEHNCNAQGLYDWTSSNPTAGRHFSGVASFELGFQDGLIVYESGKVLDRH